MWQKNIEIYNDIVELSLLQKNDNNVLISKYLRWETQFLKNLGYELNIDICSVSGNKDTYFISPKTGNAVSYEVGKKYSSKLFKIPLCMKENFEKDSYNDYLNALEITGFFFNKILENRRQKFIFRNQIVAYINNLQLGINP